MDDFFKDWRVWAVIITIIILSAAVYIINKNIKPDDDLDEDPTQPNATLSSGSALSIARRVNSSLGSFGNSNSSVIAAANDLLALGLNDLRLVHNAYKNEYSSTIRALFEGEYVSGLVCLYDWNCQEAKQKRDAVLFALSSINA